MTDPQFFQKWHRPSKIFKYASATSLHKGERFVAIVMFANPAAPEGGKANALVDYIVRKPGGEIYGQLRDQVGWKELPPKENMLELTVDYLMVRVEPTDPVGEYIVEAVVRDQISGNVLNLSRTITVASS